MITISEWKSMSGLEQTLWLEKKFPANNHSIARRKSMHGVGINNASYMIRVRVNGERIACPAYATWYGMLTRCYSSKFRSRSPTYIGVTLCDEWHSFMSFREWWMDNQVDGCELDKDLLSDAVGYSPDTCLFVPAWLNLFTVDSGAARGAYPIGVTFDKSAGRFKAQCSNPVSNKNQYLGLFVTPEEAHEAWLAHKLELALELKPRMDSIDPRIYPRVIEIINNAK